MAAHSTRPATFEDILTREDIDRLEIIAGEILEKALPTFSHGLAELKIGVAVDPYNGQPRSGAPGGWWIATEVHVE